MPPRRQDLMKSPRFQSCLTAFMALAAFTVLLQPDTATAVRKPEDLIGTWQWKETMKNPRDIVMVSRRGRFERMLVLRKNRTYELWERSGNSTPTRTQGRFQIDVLTKPERKMPMHEKAEGYLRFNPSWEAGFESYRFWLNDMNRLVLIPGGPSFHMRDAPAHTFRRIKVRPGLS